MSKLFILAYRNLLNLKCFITIWFIYNVERYFGKFYGYIIKCFESYGRNFIVMPKWEIMIKLTRSTLDYNSSNFKTEFESMELWRDARNTWWSNWILYVYSSVCWKNLFNEKSKSIFVNFFPFNLMHWTGNFVAGPFH